MATLTANKTRPTTGRWQERHNREVARNHPIVMGFRAWSQYATNHRHKHGQVLGDDWVLGEYWHAWGKGLHDLLCGDIGNLDIGTLSAFYSDVLRENGFDE